MAYHSPIAGSIRAMYGAPETYGFVVMRSPRAKVAMPSTFGSTTQS